MQPVMSAHAQSYSELNSSSELAHKFTGVAPPTNAAAASEHFVQAVLIVEPPVPPVPPVPPEPAVRPEPPVPTVPVQTGPLPTHCLIPIAFGVQAPDSQSRSSTHAWPSQHSGQRPPQSTSLSVPSCTMFVQGPSSMGN